MHEPVNVRRRVWPWRALALACVSGWLLAGCGGGGGGDPASGLVTPSSVALDSNTDTLVQIAGVQGEISARSDDTGIADVTVSSVADGAATLTVQGKAEGSTSVRLRSGDKDSSFSVTVRSSSEGLRVQPSSLALAVGSTGSLTASSVSGTLSASSSNTGVATVSVNGNVVAVRALAAGSALVTVKDRSKSVNVPVTVTGSSGGGGTTASGRHSLIAWNDLGMHCVDGKDYSVFSILPPFNNLHAQLVNASTGKVVTSGVTLTYEAVADPSGSINTSSDGKTNFWTWVKSLYGAAPAANVGLTGNATPSLTPKPLSLDATNGWFEASGIPITPYDDAGAKNYYPTVKVSAKDATGKVLASTTTVLPVSDEMTCAACHASRPATETNAARLAAKPTAGWVNDSNPETDWKKNILRLHDEKNAGNAKYSAALAAKGLGAGLLASAQAGTPTLCASCHASNALPGTGVAGISALTSALHAKHGQAVDPSNGQTLDASGNRNACYMCHPGSVTKCLRGAMGNATDAAGNATMGCQSCHGNMSKVGNPARAGWLDEPACASCHYDGKRMSNALDAAGNLVKPTDTRYATNPNVPAAGFSLFRFSKGHGGLQCEACHGATHAEYPSSHENDNLQSIALQGYAGTLRECSTCHATVPNTTAGGPHGMHTIGAAWVSRHGDVAENNTAQCAYCHGSDYRGGAMSKVKVAKSFSTENGTRSFKAGQAVGCYDCHNGPRP
ncbi:hypothetical protein BurJ1DRAFT_2767 [Burkholderiales bacterium JOSHI_001]|nr:hypothetical protein BurJ1DRAFT_2767 [Burkholderiales bacterium JOSHI_001]